MSHFVYAGHYGPEPFIDRAGELMPLSTFSVFESDGSTPATLYTDRDRTASGVSTFSTDSYGNGEFWAEPGDYRIKYLVGGSVVWLDDVSVPVDSDDVFSQSALTVSVTAPSSPEENDLWFDPSDAPDDDWVLTRGDDQTVTGAKHFLELTRWGGGVFDVTHPNAGAVGDGVTDDTAAIQAAIDAAAAAGGGEVFFPSSVYLTSSVLTVASDNVHLVSVGATVDGSSGGFDIVVLKEASNVSVTGLSVLGSGDDTGTGSGIRLRGVTDAKVSGCSVVDAEQTSILVGADAAANPSVRVKVEKNTATGCVKTTNGHGILVGDATDVLVKGNHTWGNNIGIMVYTATDVAVVGNNATGNLKYGIIADTGATDIAISGNQANENSGAIGGANPSGIYVGNSCADVAVSGNTCRGNEFHGIYGLSPTGLAASGNVCRDNGEHGLLFSSVTGGTISGNVCRDNGEHGLSVFESADVAISGNVCLDNDTGAASASGIMVNDSTGCVVTGNRSSGHTYGVRHTGASSANNVIAHNAVTGNTTATLFANVGTLWTANNTAGAVTDGAPLGTKQTKNTQTGHWTLALADQGAVVEINSTFDKTVTVPPNADVAFPVGTVVDVVRLNTGAVDIAPGSGVTVDSAGGLVDVSAQYGMARLRKRGTDAWVLTGDLA